MHSNGGEAYWSEQKGSWRLAIRYLTKVRSAHHEVSHAVPTLCNEGQSSEELLRSSLLRKWKRLAGKSGC